MARTAVYQIRLDEQEKQQAFAVLRELGVSPAQAIRVFLRQVVATRSIPFMIEQGPFVPASLAPVPHTAVTLTAISAPSITTSSMPSSTSITENLTASDADSDVFDHLDGLLEPFESAQ